MITVGDHLGRVLAETVPLPVERVPLTKAQGLCLAESLPALQAVPPWDNSAMDGYAVRAADVAAASEDRPARLRVVADLPAGTSLRPAIESGEAVRIMTGAPVPPDADAIIPVELTDGGTREVSINESPGERRHIRRAGEDKSPGDPVAAAGDLATPEMLSALASVGYGEVPVRPRPALAVISTGDELVEPGGALEYGRIPDSNALLISGIAREAGAVVTVVERVGDTEGELQQALERCSGSADAIVLTGGVSAGAYEPVKALFAGGSEVRFDRVAMQPGKPQGFGRLVSGPLLFGLPGNPVSAWVSFHVFVKPCLRAMQGRRDRHDPVLAARALAGWRGRDSRDQYLPAVIGHDETGPTVVPAAAGGSGSHLVGSLAQANGYAIVPAGAGPVAPGDTVSSVITSPETRPDPEGPVVSGTVPEASKGASVR